MKIGVVAIQGDFQKHMQAIESLADDAISGHEVRTPEDLAQVDRLIIPGGESTTVGLLMQRYGLGEAIQKAAKTGLPIWGTCMGMILLADQVEERQHQYTLGLLDITVRRNAFGAQVHSFEDEILVKGIEEPILGVFIRAPIVSALGPTVTELSHYQGKTVAVRQGVIVGTSFHPELTSDTSFLEWFLRL